MGAHATKAELKKSISLPESVAEAHIPVRQALDNDIFVLDNGDIGVVYKFNGIYDEIQSVDELSASADPLFKFLRQVVPGIPSHENLKNTVVQITCSQREVTKPLPKPSKDGEPYKFPDSPIGNLLQNEEDALFERGLVVRNFYLSLRFSPPKKKKPILRKIADSILIGSDFEKFVGKELEEIQAGISILENVLGSIEPDLTSALGARRINLHELISYYQDVLHGAEKQDLVFSDSHENVHSQIYNPVLESIEGEGLKLLDGRKIQSFVMAQGPQEYSMGMLSMFIDQIPSKSWDLVWNFSHGERKVNINLLGKMGWFENGRAHQKKYQDLLDFTDNIDNLRPYGVQSFRLITYDLDEAQSSILQSRAMDYLFARMVPESQIGLHMIISSLPLCCVPEGNNITGRSKSMRLENAMAFIPLYDGAPRNHGTVWWSGRDLVPTRFDIFAGEGNKHAIILGNSESGKSCLNGRLILEFLCRYPNGVVRILDNKTSYEKIADLFEGKVVHFSEAFLRETPYSPFALGSWEQTEKNIEEIEDACRSIFNLICTAITQLNRGISFRDIHKSLLEEALRTSINDHMKALKYASETGSADEMNPHPIWPDVFANLTVAAEQKGTKGAFEACQEIQDWTLSLGYGGRFGFIFSAREKVSHRTSDARILVYDLAGIGDDSVLKVLAGQMAFMKINQDLKNLPLSAPKLIIFEEFGMFIKGDTDEINEMNTNFVKDIAKTSRKLGAQAFAIPNNVEDLAGTPAGRAFMELANIFIFLPFNDHMLRAAKKSFGDLFSEAEYQIIGSLRLVPEDRYGMFYLRAKLTRRQYRGTALNPYSVAMDAILTTSGRQVQIYRDKKRSGFSPTEAISYLIENHPYGENIP